MVSQRWRWDTEVPPNFSTIQSEAGADSGMVTGNRQQMKMYT
jgi:hypothetical protein